jgi:Protein of unknown function (DUF3301)
VLEVWLPLLASIALAGSWYHVLRLREQATTHARRICERHGLQLLDDSVVLHRLRMHWRQGSLYITREYRFDTSLGGNDRHTASISLHGDRIVSASVPELDGLGCDVATPAVRALHDSPAPPSGTTAAHNVVPITRARKTLH